MQRNMSSMTYLLGAVLKVASSPWTDKEMVTISRLYPAHLKLTIRWISCAATQL